MRKPAEVFPPGETLRDELEERGLSQAEFAEILGRPQSRINEVLNGKRRITADLARDLAEALGTSAEFWMNLEASYQLHRVRDRPVAAIARRAAVYAKAPVREMTKRGWIEPTENIEVLEASVCRFLGVESIDDEPDLPKWAARKATAYNATTTPAECAWVMRAKQLSRTVYANKYDPKGFDKMVVELKLLVHAAPEIRHVPRVLAEAGIRFVIVQHLPKTKIDGACFWDSDQPTVALTLRFDRIDHFWFVLMHELGHVRDMEGSIDRDLQQEVSEPASEAEMRANQFASSSLVPLDKLDDFIARVRPTYKLPRIEAFAQRAGVHPGIVVGQLQHRDEVPYSIFRGTLVPVREIVTTAAVADGWGSVLPVSL